MKNGGYISNFEIITMPIICFNCLKILGKEEYNQHEHTIYLCDDCSKPLTDATEKIKNLSIEEREQHFKEVINKVKKKYKDNKEEAKW